MTLKITKHSEEALKSHQTQLDQAEFLGSESRKNHTANYPLHNRYFSNGDKPWVILVNLKNTMMLHYDGQDYTIKEGELVVFDDNVMHAWQMEKNDMDIYYYRAKTNQPARSGTYCLDEVF